MMFIPRMVGTRSNSATEEHNKVYFGEVAAEERAERQKKKQLESKAQEEDLQVIFSLYYGSFYSFRYFTFLSKVFGQDMWRYS